MSRAAQNMYLFLKTCKNRWKLLKSLKNQKCKNCIMPPILPKIQCIFFWSLGPQKKRFLGTKPGPKIFLLGTKRGLRFLGVGDQEHHFFGPQPHFLWSRLGPQINFFGPQGSGPIKDQKKIHWNVLPSKTTNIWTLYKMIHNPCQVKIETSLALFWEQRHFLFK